MSEVKKHFEEEAAVYDEIIIKLIPYYTEMMDALVTALPFNDQDEIRVLDLGCGTGSLSHAVKGRFSKAKITLVDISGKMLELAQNKVGLDSVEAAYNTDFYNYSIHGKYDAVISSLALHHLESDQDKIDYYQKIYNSLNKGGVFLNADVVLASTPQLQKRYMEKWEAYMNRSIGKKEIKENWLVKYRQEDRPAPLTDQLEWLKKIGFSSVETVWKYYNFAVYGGLKYRRRMK
jgi:tRNA (cmo5U34)-methyltransferase